MKLTGECNRCGACCSFADYVCENLDVLKSIGQPEATNCKVYDKRHTGMKIRMVRSDGEFFETECLVNGDPRESQSIVLTGALEKGCSLILEEE